VEIHFVPVASQGVADRTTYPTCHARSPHISHLLPAFVTPFATWGPSEPSAAHPIKQAWRQQRHICLDLVAQSAAAGRGDVPVQVHFAELLTYVHTALRVAERLTDALCCVVVLLCCVVVLLCPAATGGTRFIGVYLARQLVEAGHEVRRFRRRVTCVRMGGGSP
jgi:hypothetical protein